MTTRTLYGVLMSLLMAVGCQQESQPEVRKTSTNEYHAVLQYALMVDGCSWSLSVDLGGKVSQFAPTESSEKNLAEFAEKNRLLPNGICNAPVVVTMRPTGKKRDVICGWGNKETLDEADVETIRLR